MRVFQARRGARWGVERWAEGSVSPMGEAGKHGEIISPRTRRARKLVTKLVLTDC